MQIGGRFNSANEKYVKENLSGAKTKMPEWMKRTKRNAKPNRMKTFEQIQDRIASLEESVDSGNADFEYYHNYSDEALRQLGAVRQEKRAKLEALYWVLNDLCDPKGMKP